MATVKDFLTKLTSVFSTDAYIVDGRFVIGGKQSEDKNPGYCLVTIDDDKLVENIKEDMTDSKFIFIDNIRKSKTESGHVTSDSTDVKEMQMVRHQIDKVRQSVSEVLEWKTLDELLTPEQIDIVFNRNLSTELFEDDEEKGTVLVSKTMFPLIGETDLSNVYYSHRVLENDDLKGINELVFTFDYPMFQIHMVYDYMNLD